jgi:signal transduction histidine kinase
MKVMLENAGAERAVLLFNRGDKLVVEAEMHINRSSGKSIPEAHAEDSLQFPLSVINFVQRSGESIVLNNAFLEHPYSSDAYIRQNRSLSVLALPVRKGNNIVGILYLENNLVKGAFPRARVEVLKLLAAQAAISIENARLYESTLDLNRKLEKINARLQNEIEEHKKSGEMLRRSEQMLIERNRDLDTFIYKASHDLKGPLSSVIGLTNVARLDIRDPKSLEYFELIAKNTHRLDNILHDLLDLTRETKGSITCQPVLFSEMINKVLDILEHLPGYGDMKFNVSVNNTSFFQSDSKLLTSVFQNLIENAIKYRRISEERSVLNIRINGYEGNRVVIEMEDNGLGIPTEVQPRVFDMFFRAHKHSKGSGLGLYIVKTAIEKLGGTITLLSAEAKGTLFTVTLPHRVNSAEAE